jgi:hypothetical protein
MMQEIAIRSLYKLRNWSGRQIRFFKEENLPMPLLKRGILTTYILVHALILLTGPVYFWRPDASWKELIIAFFPLINFLLFFPLVTIMDFLFRFLVVNRYYAVFGQETYLVCISTVPAIGAAIIILFATLFLQDERVSVSEPLFLAMASVLFRTVELQVKDGHSSFKKGQCHEMDKSLNILISSFVYALIVFKV